MCYCMYTYSHNNPLSDSIMNLGTIVERIMKFGPISGLAIIWNSIRLRYKKFRSLRDYFMKYKAFTKSLLKRKSLLIHFLKIHFLLSRLRKLKLFFLQAINFKSLPIQYQKLNKDEFKLKISGDVDIIELE